MGGPASPSVAAIFVWQNMYNKAPALQYRHSVHSLSSRERGWGGGGGDEGDSDEGDVGHINTAPTEPVCLCTKTTTAQGTDQAQTSVLDPPPCALMVGPCEGSSRLDPPPCALMVGPCEGSSRLDPPPCALMVGL